MSKLILLGGPPGIGKTTVAHLLWHELDHCAWLEGDAVWQISPFSVTPASKRLAEANITAVLRNYLESGYAHVLLSWVLHRLDLIQRLVAPLGGLAKEVHQFTLVATPEVLRERFERDPKRGRFSELPLWRLEEAASLPTRQIDTTRLSPSEVARLIITELGAV
jgi:DNA polymerase III delta prime subunit